MIHVQDGLLRRSSAMSPDASAVETSHLVDDSPEERGRRSKAKNSKRLRLL